MPESPSDGVLEEAADGNQDNLDELADWLDARDSNLPPLAERFSDVNVRSGGAKDL
jgi:hypothetical protein